MTISACTFIGVDPRECLITCDNTYAEVITAGFLDEAVLNFDANFEETDTILVHYASNAVSLFSPSITDGVITLVAVPSPGSVTLPVVNKNNAVFDGTTGIIKDAGSRIIAGTTTAYGGGGTSNAFTVTGLSVASVGAPVIRASTNAVSIAKAVPGTNTLTVTFSADPGAGTTVDYIYSTAALT